MFSSGVLTGSLFSSIDPEEERDPPPLPTVIAFPSYKGHATIDWDNAETIPDFERLFASIIRHTDVAASHVQSLNLEVVPAVSIDKLIPVYPDDPDYAYCLGTPEDNHNGQVNQPLSKEHSKLQQDFRDRIKELDIDHDTAFRILTRTLPPKIDAPRLAYLRKFWVGLESMSPYWDCSLDTYRDVITDEADSISKRPRIDGDVSRARVIRAPFNSVPTPTTHNSNLNVLQRIRPIDTMGEISGTRRSSNSSTDTRPRAGSETASMRYKGRRTSTGKDMPEVFRADTIRALVEAVAMPFKCTIAAPRHVPVVQIRRMNQPVRQTAAVYEMPKDRDAARQGRLTGPILSIQVRPETDFDIANEEMFAAKSRLDLLRVMGELLQLGQERRREGKSEVIPGKDKWWTTVPRWGGSVEEGDPRDDNDITNDEILAVAEELVKAKKDPTARFESARPKRMRKSPAMLWKELKCGTSLWDARTDYKAIGKVQGNSWDELFLVSSLNHHVSVVKLTVHDAYLDTLTFGTNPDLASGIHEADTRPWSRPKFESSYWYDLFDRSERIEAFRGLWAIMTYLTRERRNPQ